MRELRSGIRLPALKLLTSLAAASSLLAPWNSRASKLLDTAMASPWRLHALQGSPALPLWVPRRSRTRSSTGSTILRALTVKAVVPRALAPLLLAMAPALAMAAPDGMVLSVARGTTPGDVVLGWTGAPAGPCTVYR